MKLFGKKDSSKTLKVDLTNPEGLAKFLSNQPIKTTGDVEVPSSVNVQKSDTKEEGNKTFQKAETLPEMKFSGNPQQKYTKGSIKNYYTKNIEENKEYKPYIEEKQLEKNTETKEEKEDDEFEKAKKIVYAGIEKNATEESRKLDEKFEALKNKYGAESKVTKITEEKTPEVINVVRPAKKTTVEKPIVKTKWETPEVVEVTKETEENKEEQKLKKELKEAIKENNEEKIKEIENKFYKKFIKKEEPVLETKYEDNSLSSKDILKKMEEIYDKEENEKKTEEIIEKPTSEPNVIEIKEEENKNEIKNYETEIKKTENRIKNLKFWDIKEKKNQKSILAHLKDELQKSKEEIHKESSSVENKEEKKLEEKLKEVELNRKNKLENGPLSTRLKQGVIKGLEKWENWGKEGPNAYAKRFTKMAINLALIGAISSISVDQLAKAGIGTASALSGGVTSHIVRKMTIGLGIGGIMEAGGKKIPEKLKKALPYIMIAGTIGISVITGGVGGLAVGLSSVAGLAASKLVKGKFSEEQISKKQEEAKRKLLEKSIGAIDENRLKEIENEYSKILKKYENQRIWGKLLDGAKKLSVGALVSTVSLEASGFSHDLHQHAQTNENNTVTQNNSHQNINNIKTPAQTDNTPENNQHVEQNASNNIQKENAFHEEKIEISSRGAIQTINNLKEQIHHDYPDISKAPASVQEFMKTNSTQEAIKLGMYNPGTTTESMMVQNGTLTFDEHGNLNTHYIDMKGIEHDQTLIQGQENAEVIEKYQGTMGHTGTSETHTTAGNIHNLSNQENPYALPQQEGTIIGENIGKNHINNPSEYGLPTQETTETNIGVHGINHEKMEPMNVIETPKHIDNNVEIKDAKELIKTRPEEIAHHPRNSMGGVRNMAHNYLLKNVTTTELLDKALSHQQLEQVNIMHENNINHIFPNEENTHAWYGIKDSHQLTADKILHTNIKSMNETYKPLILHFQKLHEVTGLEPIPQTAIQIGETPNEYLLRCEKFVILNGLQNKVKL